MSIRFLKTCNTGIAAIRDGFRFVGIERSPEYVEIARNRLSLELQQEVLAL